MQKEINKLMKRINAEKLKNNLKECIELYNMAGGICSEVGSYDEAIHYHEKALEICKTTGDRVGTPVTLRYIGEAKAALGLFYQAIDYIKKYLALANKNNDQVEIQRAWTTLGRVYLMQAQDLKESSHTVDESIKNAAREAEKRFTTALTLAEALKDDIDSKEFAQMKSGLLVNIGLVEDILGSHRDSVSRFVKAIDICKSAKIKEDLYRCQSVLSGIFRQWGEVSHAAKTSEEALTTAKSIGKKLLLCDAHIERGTVMMLQRDFKGAKRNFVQAYLEKSPNEEDHLKAIKLTKIAHLIVINYDEMKMDTTTPEKKIKLCDKLGDLCVYINCYKLAIEFYLRAFTEALKIQPKPIQELAKILYSIAETYADDSQYEKALMSYSKELKLRNGNDKEQCHSLIKIAHMHEYLHHTIEEVSTTYDAALEKAGRDPKLMYAVLKDYVAFLRKTHKVPADKQFTDPKYRKLDEHLLNLKSFPEVFEDVQEVQGAEDDGVDLEDEIENVDDIITDDDENDEVLVVGRRRVRGNKKFKADEVGNTPLHEACIKGNLKRVESLISHGHDINPKDNAGWIPLHEACNHGHYDIVEYLLEKGADVSNRGLKGMSPLHDAATNGHFDIMRLLIQHGANVIALTDAGETVLSCLRDYKQRNYSEMSNRSMSEYRNMEQELLNIMDKCGFNLMEENMKNLGTRAKGAGSSLEKSSTAPAPAPVAQVRSREAMNTIRDATPSTSISNPVREYRDALNTLKRKRSKNMVILESDDEIEVVEEAYRMRPSPEPYQEPYLEASQQEESPRIEEPPNRSGSPIRIDEDSSISWDAIINSPTNDSVQAITPPVPEPSTSSSMFNFTNTNSSEQNPVEHSSTAIKEPLKITIGEQKLIIPIKDKDNTIGWLKKTIIERYATVAGANPKITLKLMSDPNCILFDKDLCADVIRERSIVATIDGWSLDPMEEVYEKSCAEFNVNPENFVKAELRRIGLTGNKLNMAFTRLPEKHLRPVARALAKRDFVTVDMSCVTNIFSMAEDSKEWLETVVSWQDVVSLKFKCCNVRRAQFETLCYKGKFPKLQFLELYMNNIAYKDEKDFVEAIQSLISNNPQLQVVDLRKNYLQFLKTSGGEHSLASEEPEENLVKLLPADQAKPEKLVIRGTPQLECKIYFAKDRPSIQ